MFSNRLKDRIRDLKMTPTSLADASGVARETVKRLANGGQRPTVNVAIKLSSVLNVTLDHLFCQEIYEAKLVATPVEVKDAAPTPAAVNS